jgi:hypothetical protein
MTATLPTTDCPRAPDGQHLPTVVDTGKRDAEGRLLDGTFRQVCLQCGQEVEA